MTRLERERLAAEYVRLHNAASLEYKAAFKAVGARLWPMDNAHLLKPINQAALAENISDRWTPKLPRPLTVLDSYPDVTTKQRQQLTAAVDGIHAKYAALWSAFVKRKSAKDSLPRFAVFIAALLAWYDAQQDVERNQASGYRLDQYRPKPKAFDAQLLRRSDNSGMRSMELKLQSNGVIMHRVVGKGKMFTWSRWGTLDPKLTPEQWVKQKLREGYVVVE